MMDLVVPKNMIHPAARRIVLDCSRACQHCDLFARNGGGCGGRAFSQKSEGVLPVCFGNLADRQYGSLARQRQLEPEPADNETK